MNKNNKKTSEQCIMYKNFLNDNNYVNKVMNGKINVKVQYMN